MKEIDKSIAKSLLELSTIVIPAVGPITNIFLDRVWKSNFEKRLHKWVDTIEKFITNDGDIEWEMIIGNEEFQSLFINSTVSAMKTHKIEKVEILAESLLRIHKEKMNYDFKTYMHEQIQELTVLHINILYFIIKNPTLMFKENLEDHIITFKENWIHDLTNDQYYFICKDLEERNMIRIGEMNYNSQDHVRISPSWSSDPDKSLPFISPTKLGRNIVKFTLESVI